MTKCGLKPCNHEDYFTEENLLSHQKAVHPGLFGRKDDGGKDPWHLLPWQAVWQIVHVLEFGRKKYGANTWQGVENARERYFSAAIRHLTAWQLGEEKDVESGIHHLAHAGCCVLFLLWFEVNNQSKI